MCNVCTEAVDCVALLKHGVTFTGLGPCVKVCTEAVHCVALGTRVYITGFGHVSSMTQKCEKTKPLFFPQVKLVSHLWQRPKNTAAQWGRMLSPGSLCHACCRKPYETMFKMNINKRLLWGVHDQKTRATKGPGRNNQGCFSLLN